MGRRKFLDSLPAWLRARIGVDHQAILELIHIAQKVANRDSIVLDAGAGEGRFREFFSHARYIALDFCKGDPSWDYSRLDVIGNLLRLPLADGVCDVIICTQVLEHVPEPKIVLKELNRVARSGGHLFVSVPFWWFQHQKPYDYYRYTSFGLRYLFEQTGFKVDFIKPIGGYFWFLSVVLQGLHVHLFPIRGPLWWQWITYLPRRFIQLIFWTVVPLVLFYLDRIDQSQDFTLGYVCHCVKN
ncbi:MAG: class I SAM-dependent methyltransferase [Nitrososphaerota archaeon]